MQDFQAFTVRYSGRTNVLFSQVGVSQAFDPNTVTQNHPAIKDVTSIWDTGASCTVITKQVAGELGLIPTGKTKVSGVNNTTEENTYLANVYLPNKVAITFVKIVEVPGLTGGAGILIGMDIIGSGDFSVYTEDGKTVMTYRYPTIGGVDFVQEAGNIRSQRATMQKIEDQRSSREILSDKERQKRKRAKELAKLSRKRNKRH